ncbi:MAG: phosphatase PAP2 family protein [Actinomycetota bacterium]|nr:phosphatase PAP2 family protein [Actinomycetota bacterium]
MDARPVLTERPPRAPWMTRAGLALLAAGLFSVVAVIAVRVRGGTTPLGVDTTASRIVGSPRLGELAARAHVPAHWPRGAMGLVVGDGLPLVAAAAVIGLAAVAWSRRDIRAFAVCLLGPALAVVMTDQVLKPLVDRRHGAGLAYPSGHATGAAAVATLAVVLFHRWGGRRAAARLMPVACALPVVMGVALVRLAFHYPTDVVGGTAMGVATVVCVVLALDAQTEAGVPGPRPSDA